MGLFDFFKKKNTVTQPRNITSDLGTYEKNGIRYHRYSKTMNGATITESVPEYNEVLVFYTFLNKYPRIKSPDLLQESDYPHMIFSRVGICEVSKLHRELHTKGFYQKADNKDTLMGYKVCDIKVIIEKLGLNIKGKKEDLIDGLISQVDENVLSSMIGNQYYVISDYGKQWMTEHKMEYDWYNDDEEMTFAAYKVLRSKKGTHEIEKDRCLKTIQTDAKSFGRYDYDTLIEILKAEGNMREVVICYLKELLIDMSGALNYDSWRRGGFDSEIIEMCNTIVFTPHLVKMFPRIKDYYEPSMIDEAYNLKLPVNACSRDDFKDIAEIMFDGTMDTDTMKGYQRRLSKKLIEIGAKM